MERLDKKRGIPRYIFYARDFNWDMNISHFYLKFWRGFILLLFLTTEGAKYFAEFC
jgi:hypothetical protein